MTPRIVPETPLPSPSPQAAWGSDAIARMLQALELPYVALNPGASFRGLHDSLVNCVGNQQPQMLLCLHEESAVAIAHGYAKASGRMMGVVLHSNVGLMHGSMAIFNAWSCDVHLHRGFSMDYFGLPPADVNLLAEADVVVPLLLEACRSQPRGPAPAADSSGCERAGHDVLSLRAVADALNEATAGIDVCLTRLPLGWPGERRHFSHPLDYLGGDGGAGVGAGPGITVGAALALQGTGRLPIALLGDGDYLMSVTALWTATHYRIPCLFVVCNNRSFYNDEAHQERVARARGRPVENKWIGQRIAEPDIDLAALAAAQGARGIGPITDPAQLAKGIAQGVSAVMDGEVCVIDARVRPGYDAEISGERAARPDRAVRK